MRNVNIKKSRDGKTLTITVDLTEDYGPSKSGKTHICASTGGFTRENLPKGMGLNLTLTRPKSDQ